MFSNDEEAPPPYLPPERKRADTSTQAPSRLMKYKSWSPGIDREETWLRRKNLHKERRRAAIHGRKLDGSVTDEDLDELRACIDLGFGLGFGDEDTRSDGSGDTPPAAASSYHSHLRSLHSPFLLKTRRHYPRFLIRSTMSTEPPNGDLNLRRIVICGGGVIGACTAYFLSSLSLSSSRPLHVTLIEKSSVACAASGKAGGFLALDWCDGSPLSSLARASFHLHRSLAEQLHGSESYGYRPLKTLSLSINKQSTGGSSSRTNEGARRGLVPPWVDSSVQNVQTIGSLETTAQVHPQLFTRRMVSAAVANGNVEVVVGEVVDVAMDGGRAVGVSLRKKENGEMKVTSLDADVVVLALGPWSSKNHLVSSVFTVSGLKAHSIVLRPSEPEAITPHALFVSYISSRSSRTLDPEVYPRPTGEVYLCGMSKEDEVPDNPEEIVGEPESIAMLHEIAGTVSTHLKKAEVLAEQACFLPCTNDGVPVIGEIPGASCCYVATGHNCWGILNGPATGKALAELILNGTSTTVDLTPFSPARFNK